MRKCTCALFVTLIAIIAISAMLINRTTSDNRTLKLVHVFFRHGERTVSLNYTYKNDPHLNQLYYPYSPGHMTTKGQRTMYDVGRALRERYDDYLGDVYYPPMLSATSSSVPRAIAAMQTVLAGLFPPVEPYKIVDDLNWQPVVYDTIKPSDDDMLAFWLKCSEYLATIVERFFSNAHVANIDAQYADVYKFISAHSGDNITTMYWAAWFYSNLKAQIDFGLEVPKWTKQVYPDPLHYFYKEHWRMLVQNDVGIRYAAGRVLDQIRTTFIAKRANQLDKSRKIYLYSGHDYGISGLLAALSIDHDYALPFGSHIIVELHQTEDDENGAYYVKVYYQDYSTKENGELKTIVDCGTHCPLDRFLSRIAAFLPNPNICSPN